MQSHMKTQSVACYNCHSSDSEPYDSENGFQLVKCAVCGLVYLSPRPAADEITEATKIGEHRGDVTLDVTGRFNDGAAARYRGILGDFFPSRWAGKSPVSWLDIGCGHGELLVALREYGQGVVAARGCEPNRFKVAAARSRGLDVSFFDLATHEEQYDYVAMLNVFSHLPDPVEAFAAWKKLIKPGGFLFIETGHSAHLTPEEHHKPYYLPDHLSFANQQIVTDILTRIGFAITKVKIYRHTVFPPFHSGRAAKEFVKRMLGRPNRYKDYFPTQPNRDMFILARRAP